jgi:hypothetical protein
LRLEIYAFFSPNEALVKIAKLSRQERETLLCLANVYKESKFIIHFPSTPKFTCRINYIFNFSSKYELNCFDGIWEPDRMKPNEDRTDEEKRRIAFNKQLMIPVMKNFPQRVMDESILLTLEGQLEILELYIHRNIEG